MVSAIENEYRFLYVPTLFLRAICQVDMLKRPTFLGLIRWLFCWVYIMVTQIEFIDWDWNKSYRFLVYKKYQQDRQVHINKQLCILLCRAVLKNCTKFLLMHQFYFAAIKCITALQFYDIHALAKGRYIYIFVA